MAKQSKRPMEFGQPWAKMRFRWPWRDYQARVLGALEKHLYNDRLHIVAAPGSGKTVLGLEVFRRLGKSAVVLSPTRTIRDQWLERLGDFVEHADLDWTSRDLTDLKQFNSLTYQALHTRIRLAADSHQVFDRDLEEDEAEELESEVSGEEPDDGEVAEVVQCFRDAGIKVLILDEAHHLRAEWWSALLKIVDSLDQVTLVSLTATPPYDVIGHEWSRYIELCGPIDEEISVPELVKAGTLCPHQDYIWLVRCPGGDSEKLRKHRNAVGHLILDLESSDEFLAEILNHAWVRKAQASTREILRSPLTAMAMLAYLAARQQTAPALQSLLDLATKDIQAMNNQLWEQLLRHYLFGEGWSENAQTEKGRDELARRLRAEGLLWRQELNLTDASRHWPRLSLGSDKARACLDIHQLECQERGDALCQVILTDYIRDEDYQQPVQRELPLGAWPIFHRLVTGASPCRVSALALHTGRLTIVHHSLVRQIEDLLDDTTVTAREVPSLESFRQIQIAGDQRLTRTLTRLLVDRQIQVLVGTRALLGEGWDAPPVNSLILASVVGSFMTTNQMRGRAIRIDPANPDKVASIWHIGAFAETGPMSADVRDLQDMVNRFETFVGLAHETPVIEGGIDRLEPGFWRRQRFEFPIRDQALNRGMAKRLGQRKELRQGWQQALDESQIGRVLPTVNVPKPPRLKVFSFWGTFRVLLSQVAALVMMVAGWLLIPTLQASGQASVGAALIAIGLGLLIFTAPAAVGLARLYLRFLPIDGAMRGIALAVRDALCDCELLPEAHRHTRILCREQASGDWSIALSQGSFAEQSLFAECMHQVLAPIENPRYLVYRYQDRFRQLYVDFHAVPTVLAVRKDRAEHFLRAWNRRVCLAELIFTRNDEGRELLLKARMRAFSNAREDLARRMDRWL